MKRSSLCLVALFVGGACSSAEGANGVGGSSNGGGSRGGGGTPSNVSGSGGSVAQGGSVAAAGTAGTLSAGASSGGGGAGGAAGSAGTAGTGGSAGEVPGPDVAFCTQALDAAAVQYAGFRAAYTNTSTVPRSAKNGEVAQVGMGDWTSGFVGGNYWLLYEHTHDEAFRTAAEARTAAMDAVKTDGSSHDLGFQFMCTFGNGYRLTQNESYADVLETAASTLQTRFREPVGAIESWDAAQWDCPVIVDNMMNLNLLYTVTANGGDAQLAQIATEHAQTTLAHHFRPDSSSFHLVNYDCTTGAVLGKQTHQGLADDSSWARGQAWGLYGYTETFVNSEQPAFLVQAQKIAGYLLSHPNLPEDKVPYWDYSAPDMASTPRDASAAAITASALLELARWVEEPKRSQYREYALDVLRSLASPAYAAATGQNSHFLLMHSTGHLPASSEIDVALNYADYYYLEALLRCQALAPEGAFRPLL
jgi:unsaturated chondroitin disaccharide hydrolase